MIDKEKGFQALGKLVAAGVASPADAEKYKKGLDAGMSFADLIVSELGGDVGLRYLQEEFVQAIHFLKRRIEFDKVSLPEVLLVENSKDELWHKGKFSTLSFPKKFQEEAAEPWHPSLRKHFAPDPEVALWFNNHPKFFDDAIKILATVNGETPPNEEDIAKLNQG